jgi:hypothetical protein
MGVRRIVLPLLPVMIPAESRPRWWLDRSAWARRSWAATRAILLVAGVGQDGGETPRTFLDEEGLFPILVQHLQPLGRDPAGGLAGPGRDRVGRAGRGNSTGPEGAVGAMEEGGDLLEPFGSDLVPHWQSPAWNRRSILPTGCQVHPGLLTEQVGQSC